MRACCCLLLLCLFAPVAAGAKATPAPADQILTSGPYTIRVRDGSPGVTPAALTRISRNGRVVLTIRGWMIQRAEIRSLLGPGSDDLIVETFSGGAHCCSVCYIMRLGRRLQPLLTFDARNYGNIDFKDLDHDGRQEIIAWDDSFAYYDYSFAASPALPFVFRYERGRYRDATARFRWFVAADQKKAEQDLLEAIRRPIAKPGADEAERSREALWRRDDLRSGAVQVSGDGLLLHRKRQTERWLHSQLPQEDWAWFRPRRREIRRTVETRDRRLSYRLREPPAYGAYWEGR